MEHDLPRRLPRDDLERDNLLRRELDEATPSMGAAGLIMGAVILIIFGAIYFGPPAGDNTTVASRDLAPAPITNTTSP
jgi:hypothetical protein